MPIDFDKIDEMLGLSEEEVLKSNLESIINYILNESLWETSQDRYGDIKDIFYQKDVVQSYARKIKDKIENISLVQK